MMFGCRVSDSGQPKPAGGRDPLAVCGAQGYLDPCLALRTIPIAIEFNGRSPGLSCDSKFSSSSNCSARFVSDLRHYFEAMVHVAERPIPSGRVKFYDRLALVIEFDLASLDVLVLVVVQIAPSPVVRFIIEYGRNLILGDPGVRTNISAITGTVEPIE